MTIYPFVHVTAIAFSTYPEAIRTGLHLYPREVDLSSIKRVFAAPEIWTAYYNTVWRTVVGTALSVLVTGMGAYALSKKTLPFRRTIMTMFLFTMYFSGGIIPSFLLMRSLHLLDNRWVDGAALAGLGVQHHRHAQLLHGHPREPRGVGARSTAPRTFGSSSRSSCRCRWR